MSKAGVVSPLPECEESPDGLHHPIGKEYWENEFRDGWRAGPQVAVEDVGNGKICRFCLKADAS